MQRKYCILALLMLLIMSVSACKKDGITTELKNDCIKRTLGPNVVGLNIEFAYAMALPYNMGKIVSANVEASIPGAAGTYLENRSFYTDANGDDIGITIGNASVTNGASTEVNFTKDTCAATLRYFYFIPDEARGKTVSFTFSTKASNGEGVSYSMGPYTIAKMDLKLDIVASDNNLCYISIADMAVYNAATAATIPDKIDLVYLYRVIPGITFAHALVSPASNAEYLPGITLPAGVTNSTKFIKVWALRDFHLARLQYGIYIDDLDFQVIDFTNAPNYGINMKTESGAWVETADGKYRAYLFVNAVSNSAKTMKISIKRLTIK